MLECNDDKKVQSKQISDAYLFKQHDFKNSDTQIEYDQARDRVQIYHKIMNYFLYSYEIEQIMIDIGFIQPKDKSFSQQKDNSNQKQGQNQQIDEKIEFFKFFEHLIKIQEKQKNNSQTTPSKFTSNFTIIKNKSQFKGDIKSPSVTSEENIQNKYIEQLKIIDSDNENLQENQSYQDIENYKSEIEQFNDQNQMKVNSKIQVQIFLNQLLKLTNIISSNSNQILSQIFPTLSNNRKNFVDKYKQSKQFILHQKNINSDKEQKRKQVLDAKLLFSKERENKIQAKEKGYFGVKIKSKNQSILNNYPERRISVLGGYNLNSASQQHKFFSSFLRKDDEKCINLKRKNQQSNSRKLRSKSSKNNKININLVNSKSQQRIKKKKRKAFKKSNSQQRLKQFSQDIEQKEDISFWGDSININQSRNQNDFQVTHDPKSLKEGINNSNNQFLFKFCNSHNNTPKNSIGPKNQDLKYFKKLEMKSPQSQLISSKMNSNRQLNNTGNVDQFCPQILNDKTNLNLPKYYHKIINLNSVQINQNKEQIVFDQNQIEQRNINYQKEINLQKTMKNNIESIEQNKIENINSKKIDQFNEQDIYKDFQRLYERTKKEQTKSSNKKEQTKNKLQWQDNQTRNLNQNLIEDTNEEQTINTFQSIDTVIKGNSLYDLNINHSHKKDQKQILISQDQNHQNLIQDMGQIGLHLQTFNDQYDDKNLNLFKQDQHDLKYQTIFQNTEALINNQENHRQFDKQDFPSYKMNIDQLINVRSQLASDQKYSKIVENLSEHIIKESFLEDFSQESSNDGNSLYDKINLKLKCQLKESKQPNSSRQFKNKKKSKNNRIQSQKQSQSSGKVSKLNVNSSFSETEKKQIQKEKKSDNIRTKNAEQISLKKQNQKSYKTQLKGQNNEIEMLKQEMLQFLNKQQNDNHQQIVKQQDLFEKDSFPKLFEVDSDNSIDENQHAKQFNQSQNKQSPANSLINEKQQLQIIGKVKDQQIQINNDLKLQHFQTFAPNQELYENFFQHNSNIEQKLIDEQKFNSLGIIQTEQSKHDQAQNKRRKKTGGQPKQLNALQTISEQQSIQNSQNQIQNIQQSQIVNENQNVFKNIQDQNVKQSNLEVSKIPIEQIDNNQIEMDYKISNNIDRDKNIQINFFNQKFSNNRLSNATNQTQKQFESQQKNTKFPHLQFNIINNNQQRQLIPKGDHVKQQKSKKISKEIKQKNISKSRASLLPLNDYNVKTEKIKTTKQMVSEILKNNLKQNPPIQQKQNLQILNPIQQLQKEIKKTSYDPFKQQIHEINNSKAYSDTNEKSPICINNLKNFEMKSNNSSIYRSSSLGINQSFYQKPKKTNQAIKFEIHIDQQYGQQHLEIFDKDNIDMNVDRFALKFGIRSKSKISKLKKYIKLQFQSQFDQPNI